MTGCRIGSQGTEPPYPLICASSFLENAEGEEEREKGQGKKSHSKTHEK